MAKIHGVIDGVLKKECARCHAVLPADNEHFFKAQRGLYGRHNYCKNCCRLHQNKIKGGTPKEVLDLKVCSRPGCENPPRNRFERYCSKKCGRKIRDAQKLREQKRRAVELAGGKCLNCGYNKNLASLTFHHRDPKLKEFEISHQILPWVQVEEEIKQCDLLCANCHQEVHAQLDSKARGADKTWRDKRKLEMIAYKGGSCQSCGFNRVPQALAFHHRDPQEKSFEVSQARIVWEKLVPELDKCDLLCFNCHAEQHYAVATMLK